MTDVALERSLSSEISTFIRPHKHGPGLSVLLDNIRSAWNVGSILRTAEGFGFSHAYHCGITPGPDHPGVQKTSLGAEQVVTCSSHKDALRLVSELRETGSIILALEAIDGALPIDMLEPGAFDGKPVVLVVGHEVTGVDPAILETANRVICLPMRGRKRSFNVAVALGAAAWAISSHFSDP